MKLAQHVADLFGVNPRTKTMEQKQRFVHDVTLPAANGGVKQAQPNAIQDVTQMHMDLWRRKAEREAADTRPVWEKKPQEQDPRRHSAIALAPIVQTTEAWLFLTPEERVAKCYALADEFYKQSFTRGQQ